LAITFLPRFAGWQNENFASLSLVLNLRYRVKVT